MTFKRLQVGLCGFGTFNGFNPVLNWWKTAEYPTIVRRSGGSLSGKAIWDAGIHFDTATGEIIPGTGDVLTITRNFFAPSNAAAIAVGANFAGEEWVAEWDGTATAAFGGDIASQSDVGSNKRIMTMGSNPTNTWLTLTCDQADPPRNIRIYRKRYESVVAAGGKFNTDWLAQVSKLGKLRLMDWQCTNNNDIVHFSQLADESYSTWGYPFGDGNQQGPTQHGPKGSLHPSLIAQLANLTGCKIHVCLPVRCTDAFATSFATYLRDNTMVEVTYEFTNETFHFFFSQAQYCLTEGQAIWPGDGERYHKYYGYRSAQLMKIIGDVYGHRSNNKTRTTGRWRGALIGQSDNIGPITAALVGVAYWQSSTPSALVVSDLYGEFSAGGYFGTVPTYTTATGVEGISKTNPARVYAPGHGFANGARLKLFLSTGPTSINDTFVTVANATTNHYDLQGVDLSAAAGYLSDTTLASGAAGGASSVGVTSTTGMVASVGGALGSRIGILLDGGEYHWTTITTIVSTTVGLASALPGSAASGKRVLGYATATENNYTTRPELFDMMDLSETKFDDDVVNGGVNFPTKYTYFNQQMKRLSLVGTDVLGTMTAELYLDRYKNTAWPPLKALAETYDVEISQYESGYHLIGSGRMQAYVGVPQFNDYMLNSAWSQDIADVYAELYRASIAFDFKYPSKFQEAGGIGPSGPWAAVRFWPTTANGNTDDTGNPVWAVFGAFNGGPVPDVYAVTW